MTPGEILAESGHIDINAGRSVITVKVINDGDRSVQVGSHYHFAEANDALQFDRQAAMGFRLNIPAGNAVRFEPGVRRTVELVEIGGARRIVGFHGKVMGEIR